MNFGTSAKITPSTGKDHCGPCADVPLLIGSIESTLAVAGKVISQDHSVVLRSFRSSVPITLGTPDKNCCSNASLSPACFPLAFLQNTILLI
jgi:hypothetical protein